MKKIIYSFILIFAACSFSSAQKLVRGSLESLLDESFIGFEVNFHSIHGMTEDDFANYEENYYKAKPKLIGYILSNANVEIGQLMLTTDLSRSDVKLVLDIHNVSVNGDIAGVATICDKSGNEIAYINGISANGGVFGTKLNLMGDGSKRMGTALGKFLNKQLQKSRKSSR